MTQDSMFTIRTWNMASNTQAKTAPDERLAWLADHPADIHLLQEAPKTVESLDGYTPHWVEAYNGWGTAVLVRTAAVADVTAIDDQPPSLAGRLAQIRIRTHGGTEVLVVSLHAPTQEVLDHDGLDDLLGVLGDEGQPKLWPVDVLHHRLVPLTREGRFIVGGDFNAAAAFDQHYGPASDYFGNVRLFKRFYNGGWRDTRLRFSKEEQSTYVAPRRRAYQLDHIWADEVTAQAVTDWSVVAHVAPHLSDHSPVEVQINLV